MTAPGGERAGTAGDAIVGVVPARVVTPRTLDEAADAVTACARDRLRLVFVGGGTELGLGAAPERLDVVLRTELLDQVVEHAALDQIVTVQCGARLGPLQRMLAAHGQMLALDPPWADRATVGGVVATGAFGARRTRYGGVRDLIIGASFVRADGTRARAGGKVVKNVAGFDLPKLFTGSLGTLGLIATATFRLHPLPETSATVLFPGGGTRAAGATDDGGDVRRVMAAARAAQLEPDAAAVIIDVGPGGGDGWQLGVRFAGFARAVDQQRDRLIAVGRELGLRAEPLDDDAGAQFWRRHQSAREAPAPFRAKLAMLPAEPGAAPLIARLCGVLRAPRAVLYPALGVAFVAGDDGTAGGDGAAAQAVAVAVAAARRELAARGGSLVVHEASPAVRARVDVWGVADGPYSALPLMRRVKERLDPERRLAPGRFVGAI